MKFDGCAKSEELPQFTAPQLAGPGQITFPSKVPPNEELKCAKIR